MNASCASAAPSLLGKPVRAVRLSPAVLAAYLNDLPVAPSILPRLQNLLLNDCFNARDVLDLVRVDPALAARLIHAAGTAACTRGEPVRSLDEALLRLGAHEAYRLTATVAMSQFLNTPLQTYGINPLTFWRQSVACALAMVDLAPAAQQDDRVAYTVGLLHAIGMVFIDRHLRTANGPIGHVQGHPALQDQERQITGMDHAEVAAFALRSWNVGEEVVEPIACQFAPDRATQHRAMAVLLSEAREIAVDIASSFPSAGQPPSEAAGTDPWRQAIVAEIREIESWWH